MHLGFRRGRMARWRAVAAAVLAAMGWTTTAAYAEAPRAPAGMRVDDLRALYPRARLVQVNPEAFTRLLAAGAPGDRVVVLAQAPEQAPPALPAAATNAIAGAVTNAVSAVASNAPAAAVEDEPSAPQHVRHGRVDHPAVEPPSGSCNVMGDLDFGDDTAVVVFVLIGVVVVAALVVYVGGYVVNLFTHERDYDYWAAVEGHSSWVVGGRENGYMLGGRVAVGFTDGAAHAGVAVEAGHLDVDVETEGQPDAVPLKGFYAMAGPAIRWAMGEGANPPRVFVELLGGVTDQRHVDMVSMARAGFSLGLGSRLRWGLSVGALYLNLNPGDGPIRQKDDFTGLVGTDLGVRF